MGTGWFLILFSFFHPIYVQVFALNLLYSKMLASFNIWSMLFLGRHPSYRVCKLLAQFRVFNYTLGIFITQSYMSTHIEFSYPCNCMSDFFCFIFDSYILIVLISRRNFLFGHSLAFSSLQQIITIFSIWYPIGK